MPDLSNISRGAPASFHTPDPATSKTDTTAPPISPHQQRDPSEPVARRSGERATGLSIHALFGKVAEKMTKPLTALQALRKSPETALATIGASLATAATFAAPAVREILVALMDPKQVIGKDGLTSKDEDHNFPGGIARPGVHSDDPLSLSSAALSVAAKAFGMEKDEFIGEATTALTKASHPFSWIATKLLDLGVLLDDQKVGKDSTIRREKEFDLNVGVH